MSDSGSENDTRPNVSRRHLLVAGAALSAGAAASSAREAAAAASETRPGALRPIPIPPQVPAKEAVADLPDTRLWHWDTGGDGVPVVLLHPATGSGLIWGYQQPVFAKAGYRVIGYSRRGYYNSAPAERGKAGIGSVDLHSLIEHLGLRRVHLVASAAGGSIASDYTFSHPDRVISLTISSNQFGVRDGEIAKAAAFIRPKGWDDMPPEFRELGPSYRGVNPEGVKLWMELEHKSVVGTFFRQTLANDITQARLRTLKVPALVISGDADMSTPPSIARMIAAEISGSELVVVPESGHSVYWEQPEIFNRAILDFVGKHAK
jgi:pimeloyl-ACP methyl ester carboxylesterase